MSDKRFVAASSHVPGDGSKMKLVNNLMAAINLVGPPEAFALGIKGRTRSQPIYEVMMVGQSFMGGGA